MAKCDHCGYDTAIRNPSGYCDHLQYPDYCEICKNANLTSISIVWSAEDVLSRDANLSLKQVPKVLYHMKKGHDAGVGINWDVVDIWIDIVKGRIKWIETQKYMT